MSVPDPVGLPVGEQHATFAVDRLLSGLESLVQRHRVLALHAEHVDLHVELIAAEVAHELAMSRSALRCHPPASQAS